MQKAKSIIFLYFLCSLLTFTFLFLTSASSAAAHVLEASGSVGAVLHVDPEDDPIAKQPSSFFFAFKDKEAKFTPATCDCTVHISEQGKEIFSQPLFENNTDPSLANASFSFTFPQKDVYKVTVVGAPSDGKSFKPFTLTYTIRVANEASAISLFPSWIASNIFTIVLFVAILFSIGYYLLHQMKLHIVLSLAIFFFFVSSFPVFAHVVVKPGQAGVATFQTFTIGVPNEKDNPTVALRLVVPDGLNHISPNVKPGWKIEIKKEGEGESAKVTEISWTGGSIPEGQRDDFLFSGQVPAEGTTLTWKAYQTYQDGSVVSWDQDAKDMPDEDKEKMEEQGKGPYSTTKVINDIATTASEEKPVKSTSTANVLALAALALAATSLVMQLRKK